MSENELFKHLPTQRQVDNYDAEARGACLRNVILSQSLADCQKDELIRELADMFVEAAEKRAQNEQWEERESEKERESESEFVRRKQTAYLELIDLLKELNDGWRPYWDGPSGLSQLKWFPVHDHVLSKTWFDKEHIQQKQASEQAAKSEEVWQEIEKRLGKEKIFLALWEDYFE